MSKPRRRDVEELCFVLAVRFYKRAAAKNDILRYGAYVNSDARLRSFDIRKKARIKQSHIIVYHAVLSCRVRDTLVYIINK